MLQQSKSELASHKSSQIFIVAATQNLYNYTNPEVKKITATFALVDLLTFE
jgi:hypothetical protein